MNIRNTFSILFFSFLLLLITSCSSGEEANIRGEISNLEYPYVLAAYLSADTLVIDTIPVNQKGKFNYNVDIDTLTTFSIYMNDFESAAIVFADDGDKLKVKGDALLPDLIKITGNEINDDLTKFKLLNEDLLKQRGQLLINLQIDRATDTLNNNSNNRNEESANLNLLNHELILQAEEFIVENPTKLSSLILINNFFISSDNSKALERVLGYLEGDVTKTELARNLFTYSAKINQSAEGARMPYFQLQDKEGKSISSYEFNEKHLLLSFISTTGVDSKEMLDLLKHEYEILNSDSVQFVTIYIDSDLYPIDYIEHDSIPWLVIPEKRGWGADIIEIFNVQFIPYNILISPDGTIQVRNIPTQDVAEVIIKSSES